MGKRIRQILLAAAVTLCLILVLDLARFFDVVQALGEYLRPTTIMGNFLPQGCATTNETPPPDLMQVVEDQKNLDSLAVQKIVVCRSAHRTGFESRFNGLRFGEATRNQWRPLRQRCCSAQFGRHVIVMAADPTENGSILVQANLIQSRWDYLRLKCGAIKWVYIELGTLLFVVILLLYFCGLLLVRGIRRAIRRWA